MGARRPWRRAGRRVHGLWRGCGARGPRAQGCGACRPRAHWTRARMCTGTWPDAGASGGLRGCAHRWACSEDAQRTRWRAQWDAGPRRRDSSPSAGRFPAVPNSSPNFLERPAAAGRGFRELPAVVGVVHRLYIQAAYVPALGGKPWDCILVGYPFGDMGGSPVSKFCGN